MAVFLYVIHRLAQLTIDPGILQQPLALFMLLV